MIKTPEVKPGKHIYRIKGDRNKTTHSLKPGDGISYEEYIIEELLTEKMSFIEDIRDNDKRSLMPYKEEERSRTFCICKNLSTGAKVRLEIVSVDKKAYSSKKPAPENVLEESHVYAKDKPVIVTGVKYNDRFIKVLGKSIFIMLLLTTSCRKDNKIQYWPNPDDVQHIAEVMYTECYDCADEEKALTGAVVVNRARTQGLPISEIVRQKHQFKGLVYNNKNYDCNTEQLAFNLLSNQIKPMPDTTILNFVTHAYYKKEFSWKGSPIVICEYHTFF